MIIPNCRLPKTIRLKNFPFMPLLGLGTIWLGRRWPVDNVNYIEPSKEEKDMFLLTAYRSGIRMFDTAAAYGHSEKILGIFFKEHLNFLENSFIATKWGEDFDTDTEKLSNDHSIKNLLNSFERSQKYLPKIDLLYIHKADSNVLSNREVQTEMFRLVVKGKIKYTGASISNAQALREIFEKQLLWTDFLQTSANVVIENPSLIESIYNMGIVVVVNSPIRKRSDENLSPKESYLKLANMPFVSFVLTGTRNHLTETIGYFG